MELDRAIAAFYAQGREGVRLTVADNLEYLRTLDLLSRLLPPAPASVLDVGGGEGVYATPLVDAGYTVHLLDPVERHVAAARDAGLPADLGDARALPRADASVDAVLLLGPLYHLIERDDRLRALREARRVLRPGGMVCAAAISRYASLVDGIRRGWLADDRFATLVEGDLRDGVHRNPDDVPRWFTTAYFHHPDELRDELLAAGLVGADVYAVEGVGVAREDAELRETLLGSPAGRERLLRHLRQLEREPSLLGMTSHLLGVATAPA